MEDTLGTCDLHSIDRALGLYIVTVRCYPPFDQRQFQHALDAPRLLGAEYSHPDCGLGCVVECVTATQFLARQVNLGRFGLLQNLPPEKRYPAVCLDPGARARLNHEAMETSMARDRGYNGRERENENAGQRRGASARQTNLGRSGPIPDRLRLLCVAEPVPFATESQP